METQLISGKIPVPRLLNPASSINKDCKVYFAHMGGKAAEDKKLLYKIGAVCGNLVCVVKGGMPKGYKGEGVIETYLKATQSEKVKNAIHAKLKDFQDTSDGGNSWFYTSLIEIRRLIHDVIAAFKSKYPLDEFEWVEKVIPFECKEEEQKKD
eukprot:TRINITY_DN3753_c0_g1_i16.p1 TRINITY_DN3753_c0_g1~~TRINITY_DN3753_c0_g1_i16.p1  ORF type:complete len:153 (+),score=4.91 TRINITY_DN3753_c0_g1_i16:316-774(+)